MVTAPTRKGPVTAARYVRPVPLNLQSNVNAAGVEQRGEFKVTGVGNTQFRAFLPCEIAVVQGQLDQVTATITKKTGGDPTKFNLTIADTDTIEVTIRIKVAIAAIYEVSVNASQFQFNATIETVTQIRDALIALIDAGSEPITTSAIGTDEIKIVQADLTDKQIIVVEAPTPSFTEIQRIYDIAAAEGQNTIYRSEDDLLDPLKLPDLVLSDQFQPIKFDVKGTPGILQVIIDFEGAISSTTHEIIIEVMGEALG